MLEHERSAPGNYFCLYYKARVLINNIVAFPYYHNQFTGFTESEQYELFFKLLDNSGFTNQHLSIIELWEQRYNAAVAEYKDEKEAAKKAREAIQNFGIRMNSETT
jgi:hypothetical protein